MKRDGLTFFTELSRKKDVRYVFVRETGAGASSHAKFFLFRLLLTFFPRPRLQFHDFTGGVRGKGGRPKCMLETRDLTTLVVVGRFKLVAFIFLTDICMRGWKNAKC